MPIHHFLLHLIKVLKTNYETHIDREYPVLVNIFVGAKHSGSKSLFLINSLSTGMLRPYQIGMLPIDTSID
ncbi:hypothetical protein [Floridanema aerugineum]|uniref:Uncharacterized protein n=1 Tax=Floridaenema aerugineum BLCC-F46 TaxID=3153654 RepID=A0ABV4WYJ0_9CYAN